jgi:hypothetical protein
MKPLRRYERECMFCGKPARVYLTEGATDLDIEAEFSGQGRQFADTEDGDPVGVGCVRCARLRRQGIAR